MSIVISDDPGLSPQTRELLVRIRSDIGGLDKHQQELEADVQQIRSTPAADLTGKQLDLARDIPVQRLNLMRRELSIRNRVATEFFPARRHDRTAAAENAAARYGQLKAEVRQKLIGIGYIDGLMPGGNFESITPDILHRHPAVFAARNEANAARDHVTPQEVEQLNATAIRDLEEAMEKLKQRALQAVA